MPGYSPIYVPRSSYYMGHHDADIVDSLNKAEILSNAALDDSYEASVKSKSRDYTLLRNANAAIDSLYYRPYIIGSEALWASRPPLYYPRSLYWNEALYDPSYLLPRGGTVSLPGSITAGEGSAEASGEAAAEVVVEEKKSESVSVVESSSKTGSVNIPFYYYAGGDPYNMTVSPLRRKLRRTICKAKGNPDYYRMSLD